MERFCKKYRHLKSKIIHKFHYLLFVCFILLAFLTSFFPISPNQTCLKLLNIFVALYYTDYRFLSENFRKFLIKKKRDIVHIKKFQNSVGSYLLFNFLVFLTSFFLFYLSMVFKKFLKFLLFYLMDSRFYKKILLNYGFF